MISAAVDAFGAVDILVNNAVVRHAAPVESFSPERWDEGLAVNLSAAFHTIRLALPAMKQRGWGRIINVSSIYGLRAAPNRVAYVTTKTALLGLTRAVALETLGQDITCNAICPGTAETPIHEATIHDMMAASSLTREDGRAEISDRETADGAVHLRRERGRADGVSVRAVEPRHHGRGAARRRRVVSELGLAD